MKKIILYSIVLLSTLCWVVPSVSAQTATKWVSAKNRAIIARPGEFEIQVGDTVVISKDQRFYLSGDTIRKWVYNVCVVVEKIGGPRFPDGILLQNIHSWITPTALSLVGTAHVAQPKPAPVEQPKPVPAPAPAPAPAVKEEEPVVPVVPVVPVIPVVSETPVAPQETPVAQEAPVVPEAPIAPVVVEEVVKTPASAPEFEPTPTVAEEPVAPIVPVVVEEEKQEKEDIQENTETITEQQGTTKAIHRLSLGVRGGATSFLQDAGKAKCQLGFDALLDVQYAYYGYTAKRHQVGFLVGVSAGYARAGMTLDVIQDQFTASTSEGDIHYSVSADGVAEKHGLVMLEVPVMFSLVTHKGFFLNVGPRFQIPVYSHYALSFDNPNIDAYFVKERVPVSNRQITGRLDKGDAKGAFAVNKYNLLVGIELGYEWKLKNNDAIGLGAYANYGVYSFCQKNSESKRVIDVTAPSATVQPAQIRFNALRDVYGSERAFLDCGIKLIYHFNWIK